VGKGGGRWGGMNTLLEVSQTNGTDGRDERKGKAEEKKVIAITECYFTGKVIVNFRMWRRGGEKREERGERKGEAVQPKPRMSSR